MHVSLNANELLLPAPFSRIGLCLYISYLRCSAKKKHLFGFDYHVYHTEIINFKPYQFKLLIYGFLSAQKAAVRQYVSTNLSSLSCLIVLKLSNTHKFILKTHISYKNSRLCLRRQTAGKEIACLILDLCGSSVIYSK